MRCGRELGAAQSQGLLTAALRAMLNLLLATIVHGSFETLGLPPLWVGRVRRTSGHVSFTARHGEVATGLPLCHLSAKVLVAPVTVPKVGLMVVSVSPPHHSDRRQSLHCRRTCKSSLQEPQRASDHDHIASRSEALRILPTGDLGS